jgi:uncharacterized protein YxjI
MDQHAESKLIGPHESSRSVEKQTYLKKAATYLRSQYDVYDSDDQRVIRAKGRRFE